MNNFVYDIPVKVYFGENQLQHLGEELSKFGTRVLLTYGGGSIKKIGLYDKVIAEIERAGLEVFELSGIEPNPRIDSVRRGAQMCKDHNIDVLLAVGGGSTLDATKFMAAGACVDHDPWDFLNEKWDEEKSLVPFFYLCIICCFKPICLILRICQMKSTKANIIEAVSAIGIDIHTP